MHLPLLQSPLPIASRPMPDAGPRHISAVRVLRVSLTDRCNLRCSYCMPSSDLHWLPTSQLLTCRQIAQVARAASDIHGIDRIKLTGGEPTLRPDLLQIIHDLRAIDSIREISLTTNGILLQRLAQPLRDAGLDRVTVSLDSLRPATYRQITGNGDLATVLRGLDRVLAVGFPDTKINCVIMRGVNDDEVVDLASLTRFYPFSVRFIEYMPLGCAQIDEEAKQGCGTAAPSIALVPENEIRGRIEQSLSSLVPVARQLETGVGPARMYRLSHGRPLGRIGFISAMSSPFCDSCNRLRLTARGVLRSCLFDGGEIDLAGILNSGRSDAQQINEIAAAMGRCVQFKPQVHSGHSEVQMNRVGG